MKFKLRFQHRLLLAFLVILILMSGVTAFIIRSSAKALQKQQGKRLTYTTELLSSLIDNKQKEITNYLRLFLEDRNFTENIFFIQQFQGDPEPFKNSLEPRLESLNIAHLEVYDKTERLFFSAGKTRKIPAEIQSENRYVERRPVIFFEDNYVIISIQGPLVYSENDLGTLKIFFILDEHFWQNFSDISGAAITLAVNGANLVLSVPGGNSQVKNARSEKGLLYIGDRVFLSKSIKLPVQGKENIKLFAGLDKQVLKKEQQRLLFFSFGPLIIMFVLSFILASIISKMVSRPVLNIKKAADAFKAGNYNVRANVSSTDEIGDLAESFNSMAETTAESTLALKESAKHLESMVEQRTEQLRKSRDYLQTVIDGLAEPTIVINRDYRIVLANRRARELGGKTDPVKAGLFCYQFSNRGNNPCSTEKGHLCPLKEIIRTKTSVTVTHTHYIHTGEKRLFEIIAAPILDEKGEVIQMIESSRDITERKKLEEEKRRIEEMFWQSQKMEAVGRLAGGIAHDFSNMLTAIIGSCETILDNLKDPITLKKYADVIMKAAENASGLTGKLLAFSRRQVLELKVVNLNYLVAEMGDMIKRVIGEDIELVVIPCPELRHAKVDITQMEHVILNFVINSRDAMPGGGKLKIETVNVELDEKYCKQHAGITPGSYVMLAITDNGTGMTEEVKTHIFDPFFTTKESGQGTGLGLASAYDIIKQSGGNIWVYSEPGQGTTFKIYLPVVEKLPLMPLEEERVDIRNIPVGNETILLVEDEDLVRASTVKILQSLGYEVIAARDGNEALSKYKEYNGMIHLLLSDVIIPNMSSRDLSERLKKLSPELKVLFVSGYAGNVIAKRGILESGLSFLQKPFSKAALAHKIREVLDS